MQHTDKMRAEFEAWAASFDRDIAWSFKVGAYIDAGVDEDWDVWQASRRGMVIQLPAQYGIGGLAGDAHDRAIAMCKDAIEAAGVKVKE